LLICYSLSMLSSWKVLRKAISSAQLKSAPPGLFRERRADGY
jgi:hypothetical protein